MERKLAAIMAADVVGYSRMMGADEVGTLGNLKAFEKDVIEPVVSKHSGRIFKRMGDGYLAEFQSIVAAVECAMEWQFAASEELQFRIGVHLGDVIDEDGDVYGEGVNIAARIEPLAEAGGICLSEDAWRQVRTKLDVDFQDLKEQKLKNIDNPVRVLQIANPSRDSVSFQAASNAKEEDYPYRKLPKIVLAPFKCIGDSSEGQALRSGLTATLTTALAKFEEFALVDPGTLSEISASHETLDAGHQVGFEFVLNGTVQTVASRVRIGVSLISTVSGQPVWSETLNRELEDVFELQDDITAFIASTLSDAVGEEQAKAISDTPLNKLTAAEVMIRGIELLHNVNFEDNKTAMGIFENARDADPDALFPTLCLCWTYAIELGSGWPSSREDPIGFCLDEMRRLTRLHPRSAHIHRLTSRLYYFKGNYADGLAHAKRAYELNPFHSDMMITLGTALMWEGRPKEALVLLEKAYQTNSYIPDAFRSYLSLAYFLCDRPQDGIPILGVSEVLTPTSQVYRILLLVGLGQIAEAKRHAKALKMRHPDFESANIQMFNSFRYEEDRNRIFSALRSVSLVE
ncbi:Adenylate and Guanylate cyclase catalytic domain protein [Roseovarius albus]|uniref:Adenylate and Guanylate cyclase catalytic domain protein n=1 Tax=Roseovarius albus TaxID=1247867 RepID=A0A1X6Z9D5_9RHOB|nr:adenylate/guanylate cyclase domain-containing protein [Roseovarius albus]SLN44357.1 Adenylate and Guanylate cyclase catalytic domain protein [Roseovarius albus]